MLESFAQFLLSRRCYDCDQSILIDPKQLLCNACRDRLHFLTLPGHFPHLKKTYFDRSYSLVAYEGAAAKWIQRWKYHRQLHHTRLWLDLFATYDFAWEDFDCLIPVPLHRWRNFRRGFNQSAILASALGKKFKRPVLHKILKRVRQSAPQVHHHAEERIQNIRGAFIATKHFAQIKQKSVLLVDDVVTTGATVNECAKVLKQAQAKNVTVLTLARTL